MQIHTLREFKEQKRRELEKKAKTSVIYEIAQSGQGEGAFLSFIASGIISLAIIFSLTMPPGGHVPALVIMSVLGCVLRSLFIGWIFHLPKENWLWFTLLHIFSLDLFYPLRYLNYRKRWKEKLRESKKEFDDIAVSEDFLRIKLGNLKEDIDFRIEKTRNIISRVEKNPNKEFRDKFLRFLNSQVANLEAKGKEVEKEKSRIVSELGEFREQLAEERETKQLLEDLAFSEGTEDFLLVIEQNISRIRAQINSALESSSKEIDSLEQATKALLELKVIE